MFNDWKYISISRRIKSLVRYPRPTSFTGNRVIESFKISGTRDFIQQSFPNFKRKEKLKYSLEKEITAGKTK
jgi:hypothetical protein